MKGVEKSDKVVMKPNATRSFKVTILYTMGLTALVLLTLLALRLPVWTSVHLLVEGALGDQFGVGRTSSKMTPLILCALGISISWKAGMFNIGGEGQFVAGGLLGAIMFQWLELAHVAGVGAITLILFASIVGGSVWAGLAGFLKVKRGVDVVISTILLNFVAFQIMKWLVSGPMMEKTGGLPVTTQIPNADILYHPNPQTDLHVGVVLAVFAGLFIWYLQYRTRLGLEMRVVGANFFVARANRLPSEARQVQAMLISGGLCGLAGGIEYLAMAGQIGLDFNQNWGFLAIPVAIVGGLQPLYIIPSAFLFACLFAGSLNLGRYTQGGDAIVYVLQAVVVLGVVAMQTISHRIRASEKSLA